MTDVRTIVTRLKADTGGYTTTMRRAASETDKFDQSQQQAQRSSEKWKAVGMAAQIGGAALATGLLAAAKAASNQEQALGSVNLVAHRSPPFDGLADRRSLPATLICVPQEPSESRLLSRSGSSMRPTLVVTTSGWSSR